MESTADDWAGFRAGFSKGAWSARTRDDWRNAARALQRDGIARSGPHRARLHAMVRAQMAAAAAASTTQDTQDTEGTDDTQGTRGARGQRRTRGPRGDRWTNADAPRGDRWPGPGHHHRGRGPWGMGGPPFPGPWFAGGGRPRPRRGDVRLAVLTLLAEQPMHGYQIITELGTRSGGVWRPSPGSVYPTLQQLQDEGLVTVSEEDGRRTFSLTDAGKAEVERASAGRRAPWEAMADEADDAAGGLKSLVGQLIAATIQVATAGTHDQVAQAEKVLTDARRAMYRLLAEDEPTEPKADKSADPKADQSAEPKADS
jgi:DNA-binding PadR family transcriptional regulator